LPPDNEREKNMDNDDTREQNESAEETVTNPAECSEHTGTRENDRFIQFTKKVTSSAEKVIGASYRKTRSALASGKLEPRAGARMLQDLLDWAKSVFPPDKFESAAAWSTRHGHTGLVVAQVLTLLFGLTAAVKLSSWVYVLYGLGLVLFLAVLQYTVDKFIDAGASLIRTSPSRLASAAFLDCLALLAEIAGIMIFIRCLMQAQWSLFWIGLSVWALCDAIAYIALHPSMANISIARDVTAGEEAIGMMSFCVKSVVKIVPIVFGVGTIIGAIGLLFGIFSLMKNGDLVAGHAALKLIVLCVSLPFASYVFFAFYHLTVDILQAILNLPRKLDDLHKNR